MKMPKLLSVLIFFAIQALCLPGFSSSVADECARQIPKSLVDLLSKRFPGYRLPKVNDHSADDIAYNRKHGGNGCLSVAIGDFNGDKQQDIAALLSNEERTQVILIVAMKRNQSWAITKLPTWCESIGTCYVETLQPGVYTRTPAIDDPIQEPNERKELKSKNTSILAGTIESTGVAYVYYKGKWLYVLVSD